LTNLPPYYIATNVGEDGKTVVSYDLMERLPARPGVELVTPGRKVRECERHEVIEMVMQMVSALRW
jgi:hypothetical protein